MNNSHTKQMLKKMKKEKIVKFVTENSSKCFIVVSFVRVQFKKNCNFRFQLIWLARKSK